jgi:hypothetical protein
VIPELAPNPELGAAAELAVAGDVGVNSAVGATLELGSTSELGSGGAESPRPRLSLKSADDRQTLDLLNGIDAVNKSVAVKGIEDSISLLGSIN